MLQDKNGVIEHPIPGFEHQCAIRLSIALMRAEPRFFEDRAEGLLMTPDRTTGQVHPYIRGAPALARHIQRHFGAPAIRKPSTQQAIGEINRSGRRGIVYYHVPPGAQGMTHIDLWDPAGGLFFPVNGHFARMTTTHIPWGADDVWFWPLP
jgi:hypothetical protein